MMIPMYLRIVTVFAMLVVGYCLWDDFFRSPEDLAGPAAVQLRQASQKRVTTSATLQEQPIAAPDINLFPDQRVVLAPVSEPAAVEPQPLRRPPLPPPPLPYHVSGVWVDGQQRKIILNDGHKSSILCRHCDHASSLTEGSLLDRNYRIDKIDNEKITLTYLPLQMKQVIWLDKAMADTGT